MEYDQTLAGQCILCAEDNEVNQIVLAHTLDEQSVPYLIVSNGQEAVNAWEQLNPRLILMDISMPVMNGLDAMRIIRDSERMNGGHVPIVALTAHALNGDRERMLEGGADYYFVKPIVPSELLENIANILDHYARQQEPMPVE